MKKSNKQDPELTFGSKVVKFIKKQCMLSILSTLILLIGSLIWFDSKISPVSIDFQPAPELTGTLSINNRLANAEHLHKGLLKGCESLVLVKGFIYASCLNGQILRFNDTHVENVVKVGSAKCDKLEDCGRPLGMRYDAINHRILYIEAYTGLYELNLVTHSIKRLFPTFLHHMDPIFFNDLDILPDGDVIISQSSTKFHIHDLISILLEARPNGRVLRVNPKTGEYKILADNLVFPNGVQVHRKNQNIILVVELGRCRVLSIDLNVQAPSSQRVSIFADNLPGVPDNIRPSLNTEGYWIGFSRVRHSKDTYLFDLGMSYPTLRNLAKKFLMDPLIHMMTLSKHGIIVKLDEFGIIVESLHDPEGLKTTTSAEVLETEHYLYLSNYFLPYVVKVKYP